MHGSNGTRKLWVVTCQCKVIAVTHFKKKIPLREGLRIIVHMHTKMIVFWHAFLVDDQTTRHARVDSMAQGNIGMCLVNLGIYYTISETFPPSGGGSPDYSANVY